MKLLSRKAIPADQVLKCTCCYSKVPYAIDLEIPQEDRSIIKLCGDCISKAWDLYWATDNKPDVENFNTNLATDINEEVFPR